MIRRAVCLVSCILIAGVLASCGRASNPDGTIKRAYAWYLQTLRSGKNPLQEANASLEPLATPRFLDSLQNLRANAESNTLLDPRSFDGRLAVEDVQSSGDKATARVVLSGRTVGRQTLNVFLVKDDARWKIDDVKWIDDGSGIN
ncbi:MAG: DUF3828 domain-containing protein [Verrucomicrobia bacterium]|nr:DUF3828 domain-containing protein [Verrucomicrobiota bacterium]